MTHIFRMLTFAGVTATACAPAPQPADSTRVSGIAGETEVAGTVGIIGSAPANVRVVVQPGAGGPVGVTGPIAEEIARAAGAEVIIRGPVSSAADPLVPQAIEVVEYRILSVDGRPVIDGEIIALEDGNARLRTRDGNEIEIRGAPASFAVGQRVWVQGPTTVTVQSHGTVRP